MAGLISLGIAGGPVQRQVQAAAAQPDRPDITEYGASGTPIFGGFLRELGEYNPALTGLSAIRTYEQMRRSDAQVAATLMAIKLPIRSAQWSVKVGDDASPVEKEAGEFVKNCFFEDLNFNDVLRNALLMLDFGVAADEMVWEVVGNRVHLAKLAARLPITYYRWITDDSGENLIALEQMGYRGSEYVTVQIPAEKLHLYTFNQEGQNFTGLSLLRPMYEPWFIKSGLYRVDAISCERNGMGVPVITMAGTNPKREDRDAAIAWVEQLTAHQKTGLVLPPEWKFELAGVTGTLRDPKDSIAHHNTAISMAGLAMFMMLGQSQHGSHALGATMADFFFMSLESVSQQIARILNLGAVKLLCDYNFTGIKNYPRLVPQQILTVKFEAIVDALNKLAQFGVVEPDDDLESWMREKMGAPEADKATARALTAPAGPSGGTIAPPAGAPVNAKSGAKSGKTNQGEKSADGSKTIGPAVEGGDAGADGDVPQTPQLTPESQQQIVKGVMSELIRMIDTGSVHVSAAMGNTRRQPRGVEKHLALSDIVSALDQGRDEVAAALRAARPRVQAAIVHKLVDAQVRTMHRVSIEPDEKLIATVEDTLRGIADFGIRQVAQERDRQLAGTAAASDAATIRMADKRDAIGLFADGVVGEFTNNLQQRATNVALDKQRQGGLSKGELITSIGEDLDDQSDKWIDAVASKGANEAFAEGRNGGYEQYKDEISSVIYSALLDLNTCENCAAADGAEGETPDDIPAVPNPDCDGGDRCRCVHVFVFSDEGSTLAGTDQPRDEQGRFASWGSGHEKLKSTISEHVAAAEAAGAKLPPRAVVKAAGREGGIAAYNPVTRELEINHQDEYWQNPKGFAQMLSQERFISTDRPEHAILHEAGHYEHHMASPEHFRAGHGKLDGPEERVAAREVSKRAAFNRNEFVAETYAGMRGGKSYSPEVMKTYGKYGGPKT